MTAIATSHERGVEHARALRRGLLGDRVIVGASVFALVWLVGFSVATILTGTSSTAGKAVGDVIFLVPEAPIFVVAILAALRRRGRARLFWLLLAAFAALWLAADTVWGVID